MTSFMSRRYRVVLGALAMGLSVESAAAYAGVPARVVRGVRNAWPMYRLAGGVLTRKAHALSIQDMKRRQQRRKETK